MNRTQKRLLKALREARVLNLEQAAELVGDTQARRALYALVRLGVVFETELELAPIPRVQSPLVSTDSGVGTDLTASEIASRIRNRYAGGYHPTSVFSLGPVEPAQLHHALGLSWVYVYMQETRSGWDWSMPTRGTLERDVDALLTCRGTGAQLQIEYLSTYRAPKIQSFLTDLGGAYELF